VAPGLKELAGPLGVWIGAAVTVAPLTGEPAYGEAVRRDCSVVTPENEMKWGPIHPGRDRYDFARADAIVDFARAAGIALHGHTLLWHNQNPAWLTAGSVTPGELEALLQEHIASVVGRYAGRVAAWDVVNEALADDGTLRPSLWAQRLGPGYLALAYRAAHEADPQARLLYNDYGAEGLTRKADAQHRLLADLLAQGVPLHGVGFQVHVTAAGVPAEPFARNLERLAALGLELYVTEMDVRLPTPPTGQALAAQAEVYRSVLDVFLEQPAGKGFQTWGVTDRHSWIPGRYPGYGAGLPLDERYAPKPAYRAIGDALVRAAERRRSGQAGARGARRLG
jgi:endo-1,4-beta-xylanase